MAIQRPKRRYNKGPIRRKATTSSGAANRTGQRTPITFTMGSSTTTTNTVTFDQPVSLKGIPGYFDTSSPTIVVNGAVALNATQVALTWNATPSAAISVPFEDPAVRNSAGGYVQAGSVTFP
jgi:hypothetical protein